MKFSELGLDFKVGREQKSCEAVSVNVIDLCEICLTVYFFEKDDCGIRF